MSELMNQYNIRAREREFEFLLSLSEISYYMQFTLKQKQFTFFILSSIILLNPLNHSEESESQSDLLIAN